MTRGQVEVVLWSKSRCRLATAPEALADRLEHNEHQPLDLVRQRSLVA
jgi:hypothetical protein